MSWSIELSPLVSWPLLWVAAGVAAVLAALLFWRRMQGAVLRALSLAAMLMALANPMLRVEERQSLSNIALVVVDKSTSQTLAGREARTDAVLAGLKERLGQIAGLEVRIVEAGRSESFGHDGTDLFRGLNRALADIPADRLAGVLMVTDGNIHDAPKSAAALGFDAPVHGLLTGAEGEFDRRIEVLKAPRYGLVGSEAVAAIRIKSSVATAAGTAPAKLTIKRENQPDTTLTVGIDNDVEIPLTFPHAGMNIVEIELEPVPGELTEANNRTVIASEGVRENLRVLLVSGEPHAGERTWRNLLKSDAAVDLVHFTILRPPQKQDGTPINELSLIAFPTRELFSEKIEEFDLIIFDRYESTGILPAVYIDNIARFVEEHGGAVLVAAGEDYAKEGSLYNTPLFQVLPAAPTGRSLEEPYRPQITKLGLRHPVTAGLAASETATTGWGRWFRTVEVKTPTGSVVMSGAQGNPLLVLDHKGKGRVALLLSDHLWLWARGLEGGGPYKPLLRRLSHWLMKEPDLEEEHLSARADGLKLTIERRSMADAVPPVLLKSPAGRTTEVVLQPAGPGLWRSTVGMTEPGFYKLASDTLTAIALAGRQNSREMSEVTTTAAPLAKVLEGTGGGAFFTAARPGVAPKDVTLPRISMLSGARLLHGSGWLGLKDRQAHVVTGVRFLPLMTGLAALALLLGLMSLAWWREGK